MTSKKLGLLVILAVLVFAALMGYGDFREMGQRLAQFPITHLAAVLALALLNYLLRFFRWAYYLRVLKISAPVAVSGLVFMSGLAMSITPGKAGELLKSYLLRDRAGVAVASSAPVVVMERITDVVSVVLLGLVGLVLLPLPVVVALLAALFISGGALALVASRRSVRLLNLPLLRRWKSSLETSHDGFRLLSNPRVVAVGVALGVVAWF
ncbi:MAG: flippase-like domain-containing protein, partial [Chloroflexi bacterium]|nr:flippase-like domain-containing protein [Chloroflexota bacterium]